MGPRVLDFRMLGLSDSRFEVYIGGCQNEGPFLGTLNIRCRTIVGTHKVHAAIRLMDKILHYFKYPKLRELWYIPYNG